MHPINDFSSCIKYILSSAQMWTVEELAAALAESVGVAVAIPTVFKGWRVEHLEDATFRCVLTEFSMEMRHPSTADRPATVHCPTNHHSPLFDNLAKG